MKINERIAIIVPIYKVEKYLERCVESILKQDYKNIEILLVDDGSPDRCPIICDEYEKKDERIKVIHKKNGGLSDARNAGVEVAESKYVVFIDSDDYVESDYISTLVKLKEKYSADVVCTPLIYEFESGKQKELVNFEEQVISSESAIAMVMRARYGIGVTACSKLFRKDLLKKHPFPLGKLHEDLAVAYELYSDLENVAISNHTTYHYIQHSTSITHSTINYESLFWILDYIVDLLNKDITLDLQRALIYRLFDLVNEYCRVIDIKKEKGMIGKIQEYIKPFVHIYIRDPENEWMTRLKGLMLSENKMTFQLFCKLKDINVKRYL